MSLLPKWLVLCAAAAPLCVAATEHALLNLIRHGERFADKSITHLAPAGYDRAQYIAHCVSPSAPTLAFPKGPPSHLLAAKRQTIHGHNSTRPKETLEPLAKALKIPLDNEIDFEDIDAFARYVQAVPHGSSVFIAWEHKLIGRLAQILDPTSLAPPHYPNECRIPEWDEPDYTEGACYDVIWQFLLRRSNAQEMWRTEGFVHLHMGFAGKASGPCTEAFGPSSSFWTPSWTVDADARGFALTFCLLLLLIPSWMLGYTWGARRGKGRKQLSAPLMAV